MKHPLTIISQTGEMEIVNCYPYDDSKKRRRKSSRQRRERARYIQQERSRMADLRTQGLRAQLRKVFGL